MGEEKEILLRGKVCAYLTCRLMGDPYLCSAAGFAAGKRCARTPLAASFGATVLLHSEAFKKTLFVQLVDQTFIEKLFDGSVR